MEILREACCGADDQLGPLTMDVEIDGKAPLCSLIDLIIESGFLQYSSTRTSLIGYAGGLPVVRVHSHYYSKEEPQFLVNPNTPVQEIVAIGPIDFRF